MAESIHCPNCGRQYPFKPELAGKQVRCARCQTTFAIAAQPAANLTSFLDEELTAAATAEQAEHEQEARELPPGPAPPATTGRRRRRAKSRGQLQPGSAAFNLLLAGLLCVFMPWAQQFFSGRPAIQGPATATFTLGATVVGMIMIVASVVVSRR